MMNHTPQLFVLISTIDDGILHVADVLLPCEEGVRYVVSWQQTSSGLECPPELQRSDVTVSPMEGRGLSRNRNHAMEVALSLLDDELEDVVFIVADDDERLSADALKQVRKLYAEQPKLDVVLWQMASSEDGQLLKPYPTQPTEYRHRPRSYYASSVEMTFRSRVFMSGVRFDERFGLGSERLSAGEEAVFLEEAQRKGLRIWIYPQILCSTRRATTGRNVLDVKALRSKGAIYGYTHSLVGAFFRSLREALSLAWRNHCAVTPLFNNIWYGVKYIRR